MSIPGAFPYFLQNARSRSRLRAIAICLFRLAPASLLSRSAIVDTGEFGIDKLPAGSMIYVVHA
jgi:hypothetical protein